MFAVGRVPLSYKPALNQGAGSDLVFKIRILVGNVSNIELKVDNSVVLATRDWSEKTFLKQIDKIDAYTKTQSDEKFALKTELKDGIPTGSYLLYSSNANIPNGFLKCDGSALDKNAYAALFAVIGYTYGRSGDKFLLPNFSDGKFIRSTGGKAAALGTAQVGAILDHHHISPTTNGLCVGNTGGPINSFGTTRSGTNSTTFELVKVQGASTANENRPYNMAVVVLIKY